MALLKWTVLDVITERSANNKGVRKGTEAEIVGIASADNELGDVVHNSTVGCLQVQTGGAGVDKRTNLKMLIGSDANEATQTGTALIQVKNISYIKSAEGYTGNTLTIVAMIKTDDVGTTAHLIVEKDGGPTDELDLTTVSATFEKVTGTIDISGDSSDAVHTLEFFIQDGGAGDTITLGDLEVYGV